MSSAAERRAEQALALKVLAEYVGPSTLIYTRTDHGSGQTDYVRVYVAVQSEIHDLTYYAARAIGRATNDRGIKLGGGGYSKGLDVFLSIRQALEQSGRDQSTWREIT